MRYFILLFSIFFCALSFAQDAVWLLVDTQKKIIQVMQGTQVLDTFESISIGRNGASHKQKSGDDITPIGIYQITYSNEKSHFRKFFGLNYPSKYDAGLALYSERITYPEYQAIIKAHKNQQTPPQDTVLGGQIGIHGVGEGNDKLQGAYDWTHGCVAVSNEQIDQLAKWLYKGMKVQIK